MVGIVLSATEPYSLYPPNVTPLGNQDEIVDFLEEEHETCPIGQVMEKMHRESFGKLSELKPYHLQ